MKHKLKANYHTHVKLCGHAIGMVEDYVKVAVEEGYTSLGMSDHGPVSRDHMSPFDYSRNWLDRQMDLNIMENVYLADLRRVRELYKDKINLHFGLEIEYIAKYHDYYKELRSKFDYFNLAMHFFHKGDIVINGFGDMNYDNVLDYANSAKVAMETGLYEILVHPDVWMHEYASKNGRNEWDDRCTEATKIIIESAIKNNVYLEINCGGLYKVTAAKEVPGEYGYPRRQFWEIASTYKELNVVIGADAHDPKQLYSEEITQAKQFADKLGVNIKYFCHTIEKKDE